jgi:prevent-host-death family protein
MSQTLTFSARDAKTRFGEVLDEALGQPVAITRHDRLTAYVVSKRDFEALTNKVRELEEQLWLAKAAAARNEGFASANEVDALLAEHRNNVGNEPGNDQAGAKDPKTA